MSTHTGNIADCFGVGDHVRYIPNHADGNSNHPDCENGVVSSLTATTVFVRFFRNGMLQHTAEGCDPDNLI